LTVSFQICWAAIPILLIIIFGISISFWKQPTYGDGAVLYPDWAHGVGWFLIVLAAIQIPLVATIVIIYHARKGNAMDAFKPTDKWGPQDPELRKEWIQFKKTKKESSLRMRSLFKKKLRVSERSAFDNVAFGNGALPTHTDHNSNSTRF